MKVERITTSYGVHNIGSGNLYVASYPNPEELMGGLNAYRFPEGARVLTPELITVASGLKYSDNYEEQVLRYSSFNPNIEIILGTVAEGETKPRNAAVIVKNGQYKGITYKRVGTPTEYRWSELVPDAEQNPAFNIDATTGILICRDVVGAVLGPLALPFGLQNLPEMNRLRSADYISQNTKTLCVLSCWGFGVQSRKRLESYSKRLEIESHLDPATKSYLAFQIQLMEQLFKRYTNLEKVIFCDRAPEEQDELTSKVPLNTVYSRS